MPSDEYPDTRIQIGIVYNQLYRFVWLIIIGHARPLATDVRNLRTLVLCCGCSRKRPQKSPVEQPESVLRVFEGRSITPQPLQGAALRVLGPTSEHSLGPNRLFSSIN